MLDEAKAYVRAEARLAEIKVKLEVGKYQRAAMFAAAAAVFAIAALVALSVTAVLGFARWIGPWAGGLVAVVIFAGAAAALGFVAKRSVERIDD